ncbi:hypothetical protein AJ79_05784 [Helicocarpus griseus UAMH5409]|uniref:RING-type domain-containing protein n=1 Tax=Helicocarpus griseus UAMH5409 TaxID=1447875 RepID=A0A2B7XJE3_9EURO|nr:hypothetical protein AJ79_05784 [Helicocarpus griseus UAMH5409]
MPDGKSTGSGLVNLEAELTCSVWLIVELEFRVQSRLFLRFSRFTRYYILYQPLTLLDCLHTFCGSCLKEWFSWQASHPPGSSRSPKFTCPSCRAVIRETRHDAKVTTLLDLFLQSNPDRARSTQEKKELEQKYKPGDTILPVRHASSRRASESDTDEEDRRLVEEVREISLRDADRRNTRVNSRTRTSQPRTRDRTSATRERDRLEEARRRRRNERRAASQRPPSPDLALQARQIEHQASLRSLLSTSDGDSAIEEEILRQILEDGLLDGIDLRGLDPAQEDELSERIAEAYRRRHLRQSTSHQRTHSEGDNASRHPRNRQARSNSINERPPASRPHLLEPPLQRSGSSSRQQRSSSDQGIRRRTTSPSPRTAASSSETLIQPAARSASDITTSRRAASNNPPSSESFRHRATSSLSSARRSGESERRVRQAGIRTADRRQIFGTPSLTSPITPVASSISSPSQSTPTSQPGTVPQLTDLFPPTDRRGTSIPSSSRPSSSRSEATTRANETLFPEPSISCNRCDKEDIQYEVYKSCSRCNNGNYNLCLLCYRLGRGCQHWFGFGKSAQDRFEQKYPAGSSTVQESPHVLQSRKYQRPPAEAVRDRSNGSSRRTNNDPTKRLQSGMFCDMCHSFSDDCFWLCDICNQGEWGFCNSCVNQGKCCTHALVPIARVREDDLVEPRPPGSATFKQTPVTTSSYAIGSTIAVGSERYRPLTFSTKCNNCTYPIPPSTSRFHCPACNDGDYDLCTNCYLKLGANGKISKENGRNGWRRCLRGHRMMIVGFEDHIDGQKRVIVKDVVGGQALKDDLAVAAAATGTPTSASSTSSPHSNAQPPTPTRQDSGDWTWKDEATGASINHRRRMPRSRSAWSGSSPTTHTDPTAKMPFSSHFPPSGGVGLRLLALWSYYPDPDVTDEILFPRGAEITEAENINDDWMWGCYAGQKGLFPGGYVLVIGEVGGLE